MESLSCVSQSYEWGKVGASSAVARLRASSGGGAADARTPYAELWCGTHPSGPSRVRSSGVLLHDWLLARPAALGVAPYSAVTALPYLLKVLSVGKALSIQAHPNAALATQLHAARPDLYKDGNHKPEMAVALTPFDALCSFRSPLDGAAQLRRAPELLSLVGADASGALLAAGDADDAPQYSAALRDWYARLMSSSPEALAAATSELSARLAGGAAPRGAGASAVPPPLPVGVTALDADAVAARLLGEYPGDIGVFSPYFLNSLTLAPGTALFLGAGEPHAYLAGDCVEIMACSDNVVRAGLTPKYKDAATLLSMLTYNVSGLPAVITPAPGPAPFTRSFCAPVPEFRLDHIELAEGEKTHFPAGPSAAIILVLSGRGQAAVRGTSDAATAPLVEGAAFLQPADVIVDVVAEGDGPLIVYRAVARDD